jgi:hypothetical protein
MDDTGRPAEAPGEAPAYLVALRHVVVAQDIAQTVGEFDPDARVVVAASPAEAVQRIEGIGRIALAFVGEGPRGFAGSALAGALARRGASVVLMGGEAEAEGEAAGFAVLARPFGMGAVTALLASPPSPPGTPAGTLPGA